MRLSFAATRFALPDLCACCCAPADRVLDIRATRVSGKRVVRHESHSLGFPYCAACEAHAFAAPLPPPPALSVLELLLLVLTLGMYWPALQRRRDAIQIARIAVMPTTRPACAASGCAVGFVGWHGRVQTFDFLSESFACHVAMRNRDKLVNVDPATGARLQQLEHWLGTTASQAPTVAASAGAAASDSVTLGGALARLRHARDAAARASVVAHALPTLSEGDRVRLLEEVTRLETGRADTAAAWGKVVEDSLGAADATGGTADRHEDLSWLDRLGQADAVGSQAPSKRGRRPASSETKAQPTAPAPAVAEDEPAVRAKGPRASKARQGDDGTLNAVPIREPWISKILDGTKTWEIRSKRTKIRGTIGLIRSKSGLVVGTAEIVDVIGPLTVGQLRANAAKWGAEPDEVEGPDSEVTDQYAWVLANVRRLPKPVPYVHPSGAVIWVKLSAEVREKVVGR